MKKLRAEGWRSLRYAMLAYAVVLALALIWFALLRSRLPLKRERQ
jgi:hypothetical protein